MSDGTTLNTPQSINGTHVAEQPTSYLLLVIYQRHTLLPTVPVFSTRSPFIKFLFLFSIHLWIFSILSSQWLFSIFLFIFFSHFLFCFFFQPCLVLLLVLYLVAMQDLLSIIYPSIYGSPSIIFSLFLFFF